MTRTLPQHWWLCALILLLATSARAQYYGYGGYGGYGGGAGSTPAGSYMSGMANAIRAQGEYNLMTAEAQIPLAEAQKKEIENRVAWTNAYFEMRKINQAYVQSQKKPRSESDSWVRAAHAAPTRLSASALDPVTGKIAWPTALSGEDYTMYRHELDRLFSHRAATHGAIGDDTYTQIREATNGALEVLKSHIRDLDPPVYIDARTFLRSLANEASHPGSML